MFTNEIVVQELLDIVSEGFIFIDNEGYIKIYNRKAKEIFGIIYNQGKGHCEGRLTKGDTVIIVDTDLGIDDGGLTKKDLEKIGFAKLNLIKGDSFICIGKYKKDGIIFKKNNSSDNICVSKNIKNKKIYASMDLEKKETLIKVNDLNFKMNYIKTLGFMVVLDKNLDVKFYQAKGYTARNESIKDILFGKKFMAKGKNIKEIDVLDKHIYDIHEPTPGIDKFYSVARGKNIEYENKYFEINGRPTLCTLEGINQNDKRIGAILKVKDISELKRLIKERDSALEKLKKIENRLEKKDSAKDYFPKIIGSSKKMDEVKYLAYKSSKSDSNVLILGESGTGKSIIAKAIHDVSNRSDKNFVHVNCGSIPENLIESELFGYEKGAFTGANKKGKKGYFEKANFGTLFLDEIAELPLSMQPKLLKALQDKKFYKVGGVNEIKLDIKIICATNKNLEKQVKIGNFREDLFYRINVLPILLPPLRDRKEDIIELINILLPKLCKKVGCELKRLSVGAIQKLKSYKFPGNIRELENILERAINITESKIIYSDNLHFKTDTLRKKKKLINIKEAKNLAEKEILIKTIEKYKGDRPKILRSLDIGKSSFYQKIKKYNIDLPN